MTEHQDNALHLAMLAREMQAGWIEGAELLLMAGLLSLKADVRRSEMSTVAAQLLAPVLADIGLKVVCSGGAAA